MVRTVQCFSELDGALAWLHGRGVTTLVADSRQVGVDESVAFIAWPGFGADARQYVAAALAAGAAACLVDAQGVEAFDFDGERVAALQDLKLHTGELASQFWGQPSESLSVLAITGTNGKTSCA
jgi:UDP-N-acetylmuramyl tripeptide synthase